MRFPKCLSRRDIEITELYAFAAVISFPKCLSRRDIEIIDTALEVKDEMFPKCLSRRDIETRSSSPVLPAAYVSVMFIP